MRALTRVVVLGMVLGSFGLGYVCGSINQQPASAQGLGGLLEQAGKAGGSLGTVGQLGTSIVEMQQHVSGLQKNLDTLKTIQSALTGNK
jgi:hypothetical protein